MHRILASDEAEKLLKFFESDHLPEDLRKPAGDCANLARAMFNLPDNEEKVAGFRKLLEAKDCFVRAVIQARK